MADSVGDSGQRADGPGDARREVHARLFTAGRVRLVRAALRRLILPIVMVWALTGPIDRVSLIGATGLATDAAGQAAPRSQDTGFTVASGPIGAYFAARGGVRTFGPPVSNAFPLLGSTVQIFRDHVLKVEPTGSVSTVDLFAIGAIPFRTVGGRAIPDVDLSLVATAPAPGTPDYGARVQAFIRESAPDQWEGLPVGFYQAFLGTVRYEDALPNGGERALLTGFSHEIWGVPVSRPTRDAQDPNVVLLRWERGVMAWSRSTGSVTTVPLGEAFKQVLTGDGLGPERAAAASGSPFLLQANADAPNGVARPSDLPDTVLTTAFTPGGPAVNAAQLSGPYPATPTPTWTPFVPAQQTNTYPPLAGTPTPTLPGGSGTVPPPPGAVTGVPAPGASVPSASGAGLAAAPAGADLCYRDEQITFAPDPPRVNNEVLIAVTSSRPHPYGRLAGTERTTFVRERAGQLGWVGEWTVMLSYPGTHTYTFYVDSTIPCKSISITVLRALATRTPRPITFGGDNGNGNSNTNGNSNGNTNDNTTTSTTGGIAPYRDLSAYYNTTLNQVDCPFFQSQGEAQRTLRANPTDPNQLDIEDGVADGIACTTRTGWAYPDDRDFNIVVVATPTSGLPPTPTLTPTPVATLTPVPTPPGGP